MSYGLTPYEFVQQVYYAQEKVVLDFQPCDDKYKEVLFEANLVLQELQAEEDWSWLRERIDLGSVHTHFPHEIPEYELPDWVYKVSTLHDDCLSICTHHDHELLRVPIASVGSVHSVRQLRNDLQKLGVPFNSKLTAHVVGNTVTFNLPPRQFVGNSPHNHIYCDVQRRIPLLHICNEHCQLEDPNDPFSCPEIEERIFTEIPDPNYVVMATAARHAEGSPPAQGRIAGLQDTARQILSSMRQNDASTTDPDFIEKDNFNYWSVI